MSGLFSSPSAPKPPDMENLIRVQAELNRLNQFTPFGSLQFLNDQELQQRNNPNAPTFVEATRPVPGASFDGPPWLRGPKGRRQSREVSGFRNTQTGEFVETLPGGAILQGEGGPPTNAIMELSPEQQAQLDQRNQITSGMLGAANTRLSQLFGGGQGMTQPGGQSIQDQFGATTNPVTFGEADPSSGQQTAQGGGMLSGPFNPEIPSVGGEAAGSMGPFDQSTQAQQAVFEQARSLLEPQFQRQEGRLRQTLANQGLPTGSEAFNDEFGQFNQDRNRAFEEAAFRAVGAGNQRQNQLFQQGLAGLGAQQGVRNQNLNELQALLSGQQVQAPSMGSFFGPSQVDVMGPAGLAQNSALANFQAQQGQQNAMMGGLFGLGGSLLGAGGAAGGFSNLFG